MSPNKHIKVLFIGDIIGAYGRKITEELLPELMRELSPDFILANGENSAHGYGITLKIYTALMDMGIDGLAMGNHMFDKKELGREIAKFENMVKPANYPPAAPGKELLIIEKDGVKLGLLNLLGRTFMAAMDCPFRAADRVVEVIKKETNNIIVDMHAEATSEKVAMGFYLEGRVSAVLGTHTHVMTADDRVLPGGTSYISDVGMVGSQDSVIGMKRDAILKRFLT
ncbi:MAG: YmdB family metallophosphoesterase, partial [Candidatus Margulisbacteria bacterium]|nr:YmdB family metallophosphoesterase [Candidatus Margulisiibacteriota bacterium]